MDAESAVLVEAVEPEEAEPEVEDPPQAARLRAMVAAMSNASIFFMLFFLLMVFYLRSAPAGVSNDG